MMMFDKKELDCFFKTPPIVDTSDHVLYKFQNDSKEMIQVKLDRKTLSIEVVVEENDGGELTIGFSEIQRIKVLQKREGEILLVENLGGVMFFRFLPKFKQIMINKLMERCLRPHYRTETGKKAISDMHKQIGNAISTAIELLQKHEENT